MGNLPIIVVHDKIGRFPIVECILLHCRLITHLRSCNLLGGDVRLLKFALNLQFAARFPDCMQSLVSVSDISTPR